MNGVQFVTSAADWLLADPAHIVLAASIVAAITPTPDPGTLWGKLYRIVDLLALNVAHAKETGAPQPAPSAPALPPTLPSAPAAPAKSGQAGSARLLLAALVAALGAILGLSGCAGVQSAAVAVNSQAVQASLTVGHDQLALGREMICGIPYQSAVDAMAQDTSLAGTLPALCPAMISVPAASAPAAGPARPAIH